MEILEAIYGFLDSPFGNLLGVGGPALVYLHFALKGLKAMGEKVRSHDDWIRQRDIDRAVDAAERKHLVERVDEIEEELERIDGTIKASGGPKLKK